MAFIDIEDPKKRDKIVADYLATIQRVQQRNEDEKSANLTRQVELEKTFKPIIKATEKSTAAITEKLVNQKKQPLRRKRTWDDRTSAIDFYLNNPDKTKLDKYYGIQRDQDGKLWMGNVELTVVEGSNIILDDVGYKGTHGLWSLIMLASPNTNSYTAQDLVAYEKLIKQTDVKNNPRNVIEGSRPMQTKKRRILEELTGEGQSGSGVFLPGDIKGLTAKLSLLLAEFRAGNTSTRNEIVEILDELKRRKRISRGEYNEINTFLAL